MKTEETRAIKKQAKNVLEIINFVEGGTNDGKIPAAYRPQIKTLAQSVIDMKSEGECPPTCGVELMLRNKGDYIKAAKALDGRIKEIDSAVPMGISKAIHDLGVDPSMLVMVYWKNGGHEVLNIAAHWAVLENNK